MRIALVAPLFESVPPRLYGGTERVVHFLEAALVELGHDVHVFASGDSVTRGRLHSSSVRALRLDPSCRDVIAPQLIQLEQVMACAHRFDLVHFHVDTLQFPFNRRMRVPTLTTLHGRLDLPEQQPLFREYRELNFTSISDYQRLPMPFLNWQGTVLHGLPDGRFQPRREPGSYLAFLGRISPEKRVDRAIEIAARAGMPLRVAAKIDPADRAYFEKIEHLLRQPHVDFIGEISDAQKADFLGHAAALLFPIDWPEPFGLVMIEAMATGTPVVAWNHGSVPEVIQPGVTGVIVASMEEAVLGVREARELSRSDCAAYAARHFTARRMAEDYVKIYRRLAAETAAPRLRLEEAALDAS